jgi:flagellar M-ring protein FliF
LADAATPDLNAADANATVLNVSNGTAAAAPAAAAAAPAAAKKPPATGRSKVAQDVATRIKSLPLAQKMVLGAALFFVLLVLIYTGTSSTRQEYKVLFSGLEEKDAAAVVAALEQAKLPYKFTEGGGAIMVPDKVVYETRLKLASQGLPKSGSIGLELLENQKLGTSQFVEQVNYQRGLEGELARSISSIASVKTARVHLAVPKQSAFVRERQRPTASVVVNLHGGRYLTQQQATGIAHLIGASIPNMSAQDVTILDADGNLLAPNPDRSASGLDASQLKYVQEIESALSKRVMGILEPVAGKGNVKAQVTLDMDFNELARTQEAFGKNTPPNAGAIRSQQSVQSQGSSGPVGGIPGSLTNQPPPNAQAPIQTAPNAGGNDPRVLNAPGSAGGAANARNELTTNYEVDRTIEYLKRAKGEVRRVTAAVVVNYKSNTDDKGKVTTTAFSAQELAQMTALARDAVGFRPDRGDSVSVANIPFTPEPVESIPFYQQPGVISMTKDISMMLLTLGALGIIFFVVVKPILFPVIEEETPAVQKLEEEFDEKMKAELAAVSPEARERKRMEMELRREKQRLEEEERRRQAEEEKRMEEETRKKRAEEAQKEYEELVQYAKDFVASDAKVAAAVFKNWMQQDVAPPTQ